MAEEAPHTAWVQMDPRKLAFDSHNRFLELPGDPPQPWVLVDLASIWVANEGVPDDVGDEVDQLALRAFRLCTGPEEWIWAWDAPEDFSDELYRLWPHRAEVSDFWQVSLYPDGDNQAFVSQGFDWGIYAHRSYRPLESWALHVFGKPLLDAFAGHWPSGWSQIVTMSGADIRI